MALHALRRAEGRAIAALGVALANSVAERRAARADASPPAWSGLLEKDATKASLLAREN